MGSWHWNGKSWTGVGAKGVTAPVTPLFSVASSGSDAWAVGRIGDGALALHWNVRYRDHLGYTWWTRVQIPHALAPTNPSSVAMVSRRDVWVVGDGFVLRRRGKWGRIRPPAFVTGGTALALTKVPGTTAVWLTGYDQDLDEWHAARWTGSGWADSIVARPA
jgi:hypothetical protein